MAAAAVSLACPLRRSTRLAHAHSHPHHRRKRLHKPVNDPDIDHDSSSSDPENELTPRALRALKRQRLALDPDGLPFSSRPRPRKRRKENTSPPQRPSSKPLTPTRVQPSDTQACPRPPSLPSDACHSPHGTATTRASPSSMPDPISDPASENRPSSPTSPNDLPLPDTSKPDLSIPLPQTTSDPSPSSPDSEPLTPLTPSPESSPSLPGHDRQSLPLSPPQDPLPPPASLDALPMPQTTPNQPQPSTESFAPPPLESALDTLIPFDALHPQFDPDLPVQLPPPPTPPQLQGFELQGQFHSFPQHQLYVPPNPVFVRDREINIWKLACQERVDCLLRRYGIDYIKALVESQAHSIPREARSSLLSGTTTTPQSQTKFRLYTPASYTYSLSSWESAPGMRKASPIDDQGDDTDPSWSMDDADWIDADVDMEDEDDYEDDDDLAEVETDRVGEATLEAVEGLVITDTDAPKPDAQPTAAMDVDDTSSGSQLATKVIASSQASIPPRSVPDPSLRPLTPVPQAFPPPPLLTPPTLPPLSSLQVPLLSEPPRAFMGRGTPPDRRRLVEWSGSGRFAASGMGPPLYLSPVPQRHFSPDVGIVPMSVDPSIDPPPPQPAPTHGEWTSFLYSMLEGDGVGVGVDVGGAAHASEPTWYELGLASVPAVVPEPALALTSPQTATTIVEQSVDDGSNSSSTLRFALG